MAEGKPLPAYRIINKDEDTGKWTEVGALWTSQKVPLTGRIKIGQYDLNVIAVKPKTKKEPTATKGASKRSAQAPSPK